MLHSTKSLLVVLGTLLGVGTACAGDKFKNGGGSSADGGGSDGGGSDGGNSGGGSSDGGSSGGSGSGANVGNGSSSSAGTGNTTTGTEVTTPCGTARNVTASYAVDLCIPAGTFTMGSTSENLGGGHFSHTTTHEVALSAYLMDAYEVTVARYRACVEAGACDAPSTDTDVGCTYTEAADASEALPISCLTYAQAAAFCEWDDGRRLPTEAEWERAAAGLDALPYPWGETFACASAVIGSAASCSSLYSGPEVVGERSSGRSSDGAYDMSGNVAEWVSDWAGAYTSAAVTDPTGPSSGTYRLTRGGSYKSLITDGQTFARVSTLGTTVAPNGVRCVKSAETSD